MWVNLLLNILYTLWWLAVVKTAQEARWLPNRMAVKECRGHNWNPIPIPADLLSFPAHPRENRAGGRARPAGGRAQLSAAAAVAVPFSFSLSRFVKFKFPPE